MKIDALTTIIKSGDSWIGGLGGDTGGGGGSSRFGLTLFGISFFSFFGSLGLTLLAGLCATTGAATATSRNR